MTWDYRVVKCKHNILDDEWCYGIHETYYNKNGEVVGFTETPVDVAEYSLDDLRETLDLISECLDQPVLEYDMKFGESDYGDATREE